MHPGQAAVVSENAGKHHGYRGSQPQTQEPLGLAGGSQQLRSSRVCREDARGHYRH